MIRICGAWKVAIGILINYPGWDYDRYAGIADSLAGYLIDGGHVSNISQKNLQSILLQAYKKFYRKLLIFLSIKKNVTILSRILEATRKILFSVMM